MAVFPFCPPCPHVLQVLYVYLSWQLLVEKVKSLVLMHGGAPLPSLSFSSSLSLAIGHSWGIITVITWRKLMKKNTMTISHNRITIVFFNKKNIAPYHSDICYSSLVIVETLMKSISLHNCSVVFISATISLNGLAWSFIRETHHPFPCLKKQQLCGNTSWFIRARATGQCESVQFIANCHFYMIGL